MKFRVYIWLILIALHVYYIFIGNSDFSMIPFTLSTLLLITADLPSLSNLNVLEVDKLYNKFFRFGTVTGSVFFMFSILNLKAAIYTMDKSQLCILLMLCFIYFVVVGELIILYLKSIPIKMSRGY